jgi:hypothetical protein
MTNEVGATVGTGSGNRQPPARRFATAGYRLAPRSRTRPCPAELELRAVGKSW